MEVSRWSCDEVKSWLLNKGFPQYAELLCDVHEVDGEVLLTLTEEDLKTPPLLITKLAHVKKLHNCIQSLKQENNKCCHKKLKNGTTSNGNATLLRAKPLFGPLGLDEYDSDMDSEIENCGKRFQPEFKKLLAGCVYAFFASWFTAFVMVLVHERVPDMAKYPPLPDVFLDNVPLMPFAFKAAEICGLTLCFIWLTILVFHRHRFILLRRFFSITSTIFLLRSVTMFVTSLSVPGTHLECEASTYTMSGRIERATHIVMGLGMSLTGVQTCGDYMFSGHTAYLTLFNHFITEYTPSRFHHLHIASWVLNLFGIFFVLAAHEHYSIDVVTAFYITSRIFLYYHMLANTQSYWRSRRIRYLFPMFSFFECNVPGKVPNEYELPFANVDFRPALKYIQCMLHRGDEETTTATVTATSTRSYSSGSSRMKES